jgi:hypothetical protein
MNSEIQKAINELDSTAESVTEIKHSDMFIKTYTNSYKTWKSKQSPNELEQVKHAIADMSDKAYTEFGAWMHDEFIGLQAHMKNDNIMEDPEKLDDWLTRQGTKNPSGWKVIVKQLKKQKALNKFIRESVNEWFSIDYDEASKFVKKAWYDGLHAGRTTTGANGEKKWKLFAKEHRIDESSIAVQKAIDELYEMNSIRKKPAPRTRTSSKLSVDIDSPQSVTAFLIDQFKDSSRAKYEVDDMLSAQDDRVSDITVSWHITKKGYAPSRGDIFIDLKTGDWIDNYGSGKRFNTAKDLVSSIKKHIKADAKSIHG